MTINNPPVLDQIEQDYLWGDIQDTFYLSVEQDNNLKQTLGVIGSLGEQADLLDNAPDINSSTVQVAQVGMSKTAELVGVSMGSFMISREAVEEDPVLAKDLAVEGFKDTVKKLYNSVKLAFKKLVVLAKSLIAKVITLMDGSEKEAKSFLKVLDNQKERKPKQTNLTDKHAKTHRDFFYSTEVFLGNKKYIYIALNKSLETVKKIVEDLRQAAMDEDKANKIDFNRMRQRSDFKRMEDVNTKLGEETDDDTLTLPLYAVNKYIRTFSIKAPGIDDGVDGEEKMKSLAELKLSAKTIKVDNSDIDEKVKVMSLKEIKDMTKDAYYSAKDAKKYSRDTDKLIKDGVRDIDQLARDSDQNKYLHRMKSNMMNNLRVVTHGVYVTSIMDYAKANKDRLSGAKMHYDYYVSDI